MNLSRLITGSLIILIGFILIGVSLFTSYFLLIYGIAMFVIGLFIFFNKNEDKIEKIKFNGGKK